jgi:membrane protease YdiL (CAAX protease family)
MNGSWRIARLFVTDDRRPALLWRALGYAIAFGGCLAVRGALDGGLQGLAARLDLGPLGLVATEAVVLAVVIPAVIGVTYLFRRFVDRRPWSGMALPAPWHRGRDLSAGFGLGAAMILIVVGVELGLGWFRVVGVKEGFGLGAAVAILTARFLYFIVTAMCEEVAYRGYLLQNVAERCPLWIATLATGAVFALSHLPSNGFGWRFVLGGVVVSFLLAQMRLLSRSIWLGVGWHLGWDWIEDGVGLVPGYSPLITERAGPPLWVGRGLAVEGGLLFIIVLASGLVALLAWSWRSGRIVDWGATLAEDGSIRKHVTAIELVA